MKLNWQPPESDGGTPIIGYYIERRSKTSRNWVTLNREPVTETKYDVTDLFEGTEYEYRVLAENKVGKGPPSNPSMPVMAKDPWGKIFLCLLKQFM